MSDDTQRTLGHSALKREAMGTPVQFALHRDWDGLCYDLYLFQNEKWNTGDRTFVACPVTMVERPPFERPHAPLASLGDSELQSLTDELWKAGFRPSKCAESAVGELAAVRGHLDDMRVLVAKMTKTEFTAR